MTESMELGELPRSMKQAVIKLILKKDKVATEVKSFRPISLMACNCKIFSKLIANRLQKVLPKIIGPEQSAYMDGNQNYFLQSLLI